MNEGSDSTALPIERIKRNIERIQSICVDDLFYLEQDLDFGDKISLLFLLIADDNGTRLQYWLQQTIVASCSKELPTDFLRSWAEMEQKTNAKWRDKFIEGLCIIQAKLIVAKLGLDFGDLAQRFLPTNAASSLFIHPIAKLLYIVCEHLTLAESKSLIDQVVRNHASADDVNYSDNGELLEVYLLFWMSEEIISIGRDGEGAQSKCNLEPIVAHLKQLEMDALKETVVTVCRKFDLARTESNKIHTDKRGRANTDDSGWFDSCNPSAIHLNDPAGPSRQSYAISKATAGIVLIINQVHFTRDTNPSHLMSTRPLETRHGTERDESALAATFADFGYRIDKRQNLLHFEMVASVRDAVDRCVADKLDSIIVCILSHGFKGAVYGADSVAIRIEDIEKAMRSDRLIGKPKILIVQACQGEVTQQARQFDMLRHDGPSAYSLPVHSDSLTCIATVPGFTSIRHIEQGSWFIQTLCEKLKACARQKHFVDILTMVCRDVINKRGRDNQCMVPSYTSSLHLDLYLPAD